MEKDVSLELVIQRIKESYAKQNAALETPIHLIEEKLKEYRQAAKADLLAEFLERNGLPGGERRTEAAALALYDALHNLPEFKPVVVDAAEDPDDSAPEAEPEPEPEPEKAVEWPLLRNITPSRPLALFGGNVMDEKLQWLASWGVNAEWLSNNHGARGAGPGQKFAARIRSHAYCGVIVLNELVGHDESTMILAACRASGTLYAMGRKAGKGQLRTLCEEFEKRLKEESK